MRWLPVTIQAVVLNQQYHTVDDAYEPQAKFDWISCHYADVLHGTKHIPHACIDILVTEDAIGNAPHSNTLKRGCT